MSARDEASGDAARPAVPKRSRGWIVANTVFAVLFAFAVVVQFNDPDPLAWVAVYGFATVACVLAALGRGSRLLPALVALACLLWAASIAPRVLGQVEFLSMFGAFEMENVGIEESREMYGLLLIGGWMVVLAWRGRR